MKTFALSALLCALCVLIRRAEVAKDAKVP
jgi:hypothetical protein